MSSVHCVVVWEWECEGQWLPHTPGVTRTLERAYDKKLTRVVLADADPALKGHYVNLRTLTQCFDTPEGGSVCCGVRRSVYDVQSPGGRGLRWEWAALAAPLRYEPMPMELQCYVEAAWGAGADSVWWRGWRVCLRRRQCLGPAGRRLLRRAPTPPYPLVHAETPKPRIPQQRTGPPALTMTPVQKCRCSHPPHQYPGPCVDGKVAGAGACRCRWCRCRPRQRRRRSGRSPQCVPPLTRKPNLARQILHNLNIFSSGSKPADGAPQDAARAPAATAWTPCPPTSATAARTACSSGQWVNCSTVARAATMYSKHQHQIAAVTLPPMTIFWSWNRRRALKPRCGEWWEKVGGIESAMAASGAACARAAWPPSGGGVACPPRPRRSTRRAGCRV
ncbi:hypothetical protein ACJJTC_001675 [Scirpophaga incertulas]